MVDLPKLPGQDTERAIANVGEHAAKTLVDALRELGMSWIARTAAARNADADEIKKDISHERQMVRDTKDTAYRRKFEIEEFEHQQRLVQRAVGRKLDEMVGEQRSVEYVLNKSLTYNGADPEKEAQRDISQDWLRRFFRYVADVDETQILEIFAQALSAAAIRSRPLLSPKALDTLRFFEPHTRDMFVSCANLIGAFGSVPRSFLERSAKNNNWDFDLPLMVEMDLLKTESQAYYQCPVGRFKLSLSYDVSVKDEISLVKMTYVGRSIIGLLDKNHREIADPNSFSRSLERLFELQQALGVNENVLADLGTTLVSELSIAQMLDVEATLDRGNVVMNNEKKEYHDPFGFEQKLEIQALSDENRQCVDALIYPFEYFDRKQARSLRRTD